MAIVKSLFGLEGSIGEFTFYKMRGSNKVYMRKKRGPTKKKLANSPSYEKVRKHQKEFSGCAKFGSLARSSFGGLHQMADYNLTPFLIGMGKFIMKLDLISELGKRSIMLSDHTKIMEGFNFNRKCHFDTILRVMLNVVVDRENLNAVITIPGIKPKYEIRNKYSCQVFRIIAVIGCLTDMIYNPNYEKYEPVVDNLRNACNRINGEWYSIKSMVPEQTFTLQMPESRKAEITDNVSLVLSIAIQFGEVGLNGLPVEKKYGGYGIVLKVF